jgi:2-polyprenyl-6-methoxyphenol hydroxylase-like FAD-dependent oxidoreductase
MPNPFARQAVVIGAGMGGLAAAGAVAPYFERVTVLDRDTLHDAPTRRPGTPQAQHAHALLAAGQRALESLFPSIERDLAAAGAVTLRAGRDVIMERPGYDPFPRRDLGFDVFSLSRPLLESVCRRRVREVPNVELRSRTRAIGIVPSANGDAVVGVRHEGDAGRPETLVADLVVDASGRAAPTLAFLESIRSPKPELIEIGIDVGYATAIFEIPREAPMEWMGVAHAPSAPDVTRGGLLLPMEHGQWVVSIGGRYGDYPPSDLDGFMAFTKTFRTPTIHDAIRSAKPAGEVARYNLLASVRRRFDRLDRFPRGLIPIGDSVCRFNPVFGQGMSVAAMEAVVLGKQLARRSGRADPLDVLAEDYLAEIQGCLEAPWATAETDFVYPQTRGERPPDFEKRLQYGAALLRLAARDPEVHRTIAEVSSLLKPQCALRDPALANRVTALMKAAA